MGPMIQVECARGYALTVPMPPCSIQSTRTRCQSCIDGKARMKTHSKRDKPPLAIFKHGQPNMFAIFQAAHPDIERHIQDESQDSLCPHDCDFSVVSIDIFDGEQCHTPNLGPLPSDLLTFSFSVPTPRSLHPPSACMTYSLARVWYDVASSSSPVCTKEASQFLVREPVGTFTNRPARSFALLRLPIRHPCFPS